MSSATTTTSTPVVLAPSNGCESSSGSQFDISQLPSVKKGLSTEEEASRRRRTCRFIEEAGRVLKLPRVAISTAMVFFHRFYAKHAFQEHDRFEVAVAALVLAAKTEEAPKKLNTVIQDCYKLKARAMKSGRLSQQKNHAAGGGSSSLSPKEDNDSATASPPSSVSYLDTKGEEFLKLKERILLQERVILHTIGFELSIEHPYKFFVEQIKNLIQTRKLKYGASKADAHNNNKHHNKSNSEIMSKMMNELVQYSMSTANDSYQTSLCLQFGPKQIATACVYLACMFSGVEPQNGDWKKTLFSAETNNNGGGADNNNNNSGGGDTDYDVEALVSVCVQVIDLIADKKASDTKSVQRIRTAIELLKNRKRPPPPRPPPPSSAESHKRQRL